MPMPRLRSFALRSAAWASIGLLIACSSGPKPQVGITRLDPEPATEPVHPTAIEPVPATPQAAAVTGVQPAPALANIPEAPSVEVPAPPSKLSAARTGSPSIPGGVLPLSVWAPLLSLSDTQVTKRAYPQTYEVKNDVALAAFTIGQQFARWNGLNIALGFAPVLVKGELALHSLDIAKNLYPLFHGRLTLKETNRVLVIDPGHGGRDAGSRCAGGRNVWEKELTLDWARRIEKGLEGSGWSVVLTRRDDRDLSLLERVAIADQHRADLFISLHFNSFDNGPASNLESGIETYCVTPAGMPSNLKRGFEDDARKVFANNRFDSENVILAARLHASLLNATGRKDRGLRRARFMTVLREQKRPAVLIEGGFLSNPAEVALILQPEFREKMAQAVCQALPN
jgi:N-acetylmuramoyl-L-alanine amidase